MFLFGYSCVWIWFLGGTFILLKIYNKLTTGIYHGKEKLSGKTVIVTGANAGIGKVSAKDFAKRGAKVIMVCRNIEKAEKIRSEIIKETGNYNIIIKYIDFHSLESVRKCANEIKSEENKIHILLNNAGAVSKSFTKTIDGLDSIMQSNHFGPFLFTNLLLGVIKKSTPSRIVNVSSLAYKSAKMNLETIKTPKGITFWEVYSNSKLCNIYFTLELSRKLNGSGVTVNCLHPGIFASDIIREGNWLFKFMYNFIISILFKSIEEGAQTSLYLCVSSDITNVTGKYFSDCKETGLSKEARDMNIAKKVWDISEEAVNLQPSEMHYK